MSKDIWLFSYGTLRQPEVQRELFGREVPSVDDVLTGFRIDTIAISNPAVVESSGSDRHPILRRGTVEQKVRGVALQLSASELESADRYEAADYSRFNVTLDSGREAYVYVGRAYEGAEFLTRDALGTHRDGSKVN